MVRGTKWEEKRKISGAWERSRLLFLFSPQDPTHFFFHLPDFQFSPLNEGLQQVTMLLTLYALREILLCLMRDGFTCIGSVFNITVFSLIILCFNLRTKMANRILPNMAAHQNLKVTAFYFTCTAEGLLHSHQNHTRYDVMQFQY